MVTVLEVFSSIALILDPALYIKHGSEHPLSPE